MHRRVFLILIITMISTLYGNDILVSNIEELNKAISNAVPGDTITMANGVWTNAAINFNAKAGPGGPIILRGQTPGKVILNGKSKLIFNNPYLMAQDLYFKDGALSGLNSDTTDYVILFNTDRCRLKNSAIENYNPEDFSTYYYWVFFSGNYNRLDHCTFIGKNHMGPVVGNDYSGVGGKDSKHNRTVYCYFKDIPYHNSNDREIFRIWGYGRSEETGMDGAFFLIEHNLFENADGEGSEIISLKSNHNSVMYNTIRESRGAIVGRSGNSNVIENNFILGNNKKGTAGIRVAGQTHNIMNNYIADIEGNGIMLMAGEFIDSALTPNYKPVLREGTTLGRVPRYGKVIGAAISNNTFVNVQGSDIVLGTGYKSGWPESQRVLLPERVTISNNIILKSNNGTAISSPEQDTNPPLDKFIFKPNIYFANIIYGGEVKVDPLPKGIKFVDPLLKLADDGLYRPIENSPAIGEARELLVVEDMDGQPRKHKADIGADEISDRTISIRPLTSKNVGASWLR